MAQMNPVTVFSCGTTTKPKSCATAECGYAASTRCIYPLMGKKQGQHCDRNLCQSHIVWVGNDPHCGAHAKMVRDAAKARR